MGPMTNLAEIAAAAPGLLPRLRVTQMGGAFTARQPGRAGHNLRLDPAAARTVLAAVAAGQLRAIELITSDVTWTPAIGVTADSALYKTLAAAPGGWAALAAAHLGRWFACCHPESRQHDALTLTAALALPFVTSIPARVTVDTAGLMTRSGPGEGTAVLVSATARYEAFMNWLQSALAGRG